MLAWRADCDVVLILGDLVFPVELGDGIPACRCYRCGVLLHAGILRTESDLLPVRPVCARCE